MKLITVVICTYNPRMDYLKEVLESLSKQTLTVSSWDLIIIDNNSDPGLALDKEVSWHPSCRIVREEKIGLTNARLRAIKESNSEYIVYFDDDNIVDSEYLEIALSKVEQNPGLGVWGAGRILPEYEVEPDGSLGPFLPLLALRDDKEDAVFQDPYNRYLPYGAGLICRAELAKRYAQEISHCSLRSVLGRNGANLMSGEDDEFSWVAHGMGLDIGTFVDMQITHLIPERRVERSYLEELTIGLGYTAVILSHLHHGGQANPYLKPGLLRIIKRLFQLKPRKVAREGLNFLKDFKLSSAEKRLRKLKCDGWIQGEKFLEKYRANDFEGD